MNEPTEQFLLRLSTDLIRRLETAARRFNRRSRNQVAAEVLEQCLPIWEQAEGAKLAVLEQHRALGSQFASERAQHQAFTLEQPSDGATPVEMFIPEPTTVPVIGGKRATDKYKSRAAGSRTAAAQSPSRHRTRKESKKP